MKKESQPLTKISHPIPKERPSQGILPALITAFVTAMAAEGCTVRLPDTASQTYQEMQDDRLPQITPEQLETTWQRLRQRMEREAEHPQSPAGQLPILTGESIISDTSNGFDLSSFPHVNHRSERIAAIDRSLITIARETADGTPQHALAVYYRDTTLRETERSPIAGSNVNRMERHRHGIAHLVPLESATTTLPTMESWEPMQTFVMAVPTSGFGLTEEEARVRAFRNLAELMLTAEQETREIGTARSAAIDPMGRTLHTLRYDSQAVVFYVLGIDEISYRETPAGSGHIEATMRLRVRVNGPRIPNGEPLELRETPLNFFDDSDHP